MPKGVLPADADVVLSTPERPSAAGEHESVATTEVPAFRPLATNRTRQPLLRPDRNVGMGQEGSVSDTQAWPRSVGKAENRRPSPADPQGETKRALVQPSRGEQCLLFVPLTFALCAGICVGFAVAHIIRDREGPSIQYLSEVQAVASSVLSFLEESVSSRDSSKRWPRAREVVLGGLDAEAGREGARSGANHSEPNGPATKPPVTTGDRLTTGNQRVHADNKALSAPSAISVDMGISNVDLMTLAARAERERAKGQIEGPPSDNAATGLVTLTRGDAAMRAGDVVSARRFYEIAAMAGLPGAARAVARTYDPEHLRQVAIRGVRGESEVAKYWYRVAIESGDKEAAQDLQQLLKVLGPDRH